MASAKYWVWLAAQERLSVAEKAALLRSYGDPEAVFFAPKGELSRVEQLRESSMEELEKHDLRRANEILGACEEQGLRIICQQDSGYPARLKNIYAPPLVLYAKGKLCELDEEAAIAVIGTRKASPYGLGMARKLSEGIIRCGGVVLSGLGSGIDGEAAKAALAADGLCVGVLGTAHEAADGWLVREVAKWGLLLSEHAPGTVSQNHFFRTRNRITSGLSVGVVVVEAPETSGALLFASEAVEQGKDIFSVPGEVGAPNSVGTIQLIREGATPVTCGWDVMREFVGRFPDKVRRPQEQTQEKPLVSRAAETLRKAPEGAGRQEKSVDKAPQQAYIDWKEQLSALSADQLKIIAAIEKNSSHIDDIVEETGLGAAKVLAQLTVLEIKGIIRREAGRRIALKITKK